MLRTTLALALLACGGRLLAQEAGPTPDEALKRLKEGNARFVTDKLKEAEPPSKQRVATAPSQRPIAVILTCADSRAAAEYIFDKGLGTLFVLRVAGNVSTTELAASAEYAAAVLQAPLVVVLGHTSCGAVEAAVQDKELPTANLKQLISLVHTGGQKDLDAAIRANVERQVELLPKQSKLLQDFAGSGRIKIVGGVYDLKSGEVKWLENK